jgi:hypothetical protein
MGYLYYGNNSYTVKIDDRPLAHLKIAVLSLLRSGKSIAFSFEWSTGEGTVRETLWISPSTEIRFRFDDSSPVEINEGWVRSIIASEGAPTGLRLVKEPVEVAPAAVAVG